MPSAPVIITSAFTPPSPSAPAAVASAFSAGSPSAPAVVTGAFSAGTPTAPRAITSGFSAGSPSAPAVVSTNWTQPNGPVTGYQQYEDLLQPGGMVSLYESGSANGFPIYRSGSGPSNIGFQAFLTTELSTGGLNYVWVYQILFDGTLFASWKEDHDAEVTTANPSLVATWYDEETGTEVTDGLPFFLPLYGPLSAPRAITSAFTPGTPTAPRAITSAFSAGSPSAPVVIRAAYTPPTPSAPPAITT